MKPWLCIFLFLLILLSDGYAQEQPYDKSYIKKLEKLRLKEKSGKKISPRDQQFLRSHEATEKLRALANEEGLLVQKLRQSLNISAELLQQMKKNNKDKMDKNPQNEGYKEYDR